MVFESADSPYVSHWERLSDRMGPHSIYHTAGTDLQVLLISQQ